MTIDPMVLTPESAGIPGLPGLSPQAGASIVPGPGGPPYEIWEPQFSSDVYREHLGIGLDKIAAKRPWIDARWDYYEGRHREKVLTQKLIQVMRMTYQALSTMFTNYCSLVVNAPLSRLKVVGWKAEKPVSEADPEVQPDAEGNATPDAAITEANEIWRQNDLDLEAEEIHRDALVAGESYITVWPRTDANGELVTDEDGDLVYDVLRQDARNMHVEFASKRRRDIAWALKCWFDGGLWHAVLYYPNEVVRFMGEPKKQAGQNGPRGSAPMDPEAWYPDPDNPGGWHDFGVVPVVRFARTWNGHSVLDDVMPIQDRINKLTADKIVTAEFAAFPQRWVLTNEDVPAAALRAGAGTVWNIPPNSTNEETGEEGKTQVGQFPTADLGNYDKTISQEVNAFFTVGNLPRHLKVDPGVAPTGEAIKADEAPFIAQVSGYRDLFGPAWADVFALCGIFVAPVWKDVEVRNQLAQAQVFQAFVQGGMPAQIAAKIALDLPDEILKQLDNVAVLQPGATVLSSDQGEQPTEDPPSDGIAPTDSGQDA